jgi:hypothetical protein
MVLLQALELERIPTRAEVEAELHRPKGYGKQRLPSSHMSDISARGSRPEGKSPSSHVTEVVVQRDIDMRLGGLEASMKLILEHLQIPLQRSSIAPQVPERVRSAEDSSAGKPQEEIHRNASERLQEVCM